MLRNKIIAIYAGHGGNDSGAVAGGRKEEDLTLSVSNAVTAILKGWGYTVINNRTTDVPRSITLDAKLANEKNAVALVEIHFNSNSGKPESGAEAYISIRDTARGGLAKRMANAILLRLAELGLPNRGIFTSVNANKIDTFGILRLTKMPAVLLEVAFMNNPHDMEVFDVEKSATAIAEGIRQIFPL
jgi:N-acetylmuramoyl-L-alanine amidase